MKGVPLLKISRWQVFKRQNDEMVVCKKCEATYFLEDGTEKASVWIRLPRHCPRCNAFMITDKCWFPPKE